MKSWACLVMVLICTQASAAPQRTPQYPKLRPVRVGAPTSLVPKAWAVGQWASYARQSKYGRGFERLSIVSKDVCGYWFELVVHDRETWTWDFCVRSSGDSTLTPGALSVVIVRRGREPPVFVDLRDRIAINDYEWLIKRIRPGWWTGREPREDVSVPAGSFAQTLRTAPDGATRWSHPEVPFDGNVKYRQDDGTLDEQLVAYGDSGAESSLPSLVVELVERAKPTPLPRLFIGFGFGLGLYTRPEIEAVNDGVSSVVLYGVRAARTLDIHAEMQTPLRSFDGSLDTGIVAARWYPWREKVVSGRPGLYAKVGLGFSSVTTDPDEESDTRLGLNCAIGLTTPTGKDWSSALEIGDYMAFGGDRVHHAVVMTFQVQMHLSFFRRD